MDHSCLPIILLPSLDTSKHRHVHSTQQPLLAKGPTGNLLPQITVTFSCAQSQGRISVSLFSTIEDEVEVTGLKESSLVSQQEGSVQLLCPQQTGGMRQLRLFRRLFPPTSWIWL